MPKSARTRISLAKLSRPRLHEALPRGPLFAKLDELRTRGAIWIDAPPGAGKTSLVGSWLDARHIESVWYQVDASDNDLATCISFLVQLARQGRGRKPLPYLTPEYLHDEAGFARRFVRELFARFSPETVYVFDNCHEAASPALHGLLKIAIEELPPSACLVMISRQAPPSEFAKEVANRTLAHLSGDSMHLTLSETRAIVERARPDLLPHAKRLQAESNGWAAGLILLLSGPAARPDRGEGPANLSREALFAYFANELFSKTPHAEQDFLMRTALLNQVDPATASRLTGDGDAAAILEALHRRNYFTDRQADKETRYRYHDLFREFLLDRARRAFPEEVWRQIQLNAARLLREQGDLDAALERLHEAQAWDELAAVLKGHAQDLVRQGRRASALRWLEVLPAPQRASDAWLLYWQGTLTAIVDIPAGREDLGRAAELFRLQRDLDGEVWALSTYIDGYCREWNTVTAMDPWLDRLRALLLAHHDALTEESRAAAQVSLLTGLMYRRPGDPLLPRLAAEVRSRLSREEDRNERQRAEVFLIFYYELMGDFAAAAPLVQSARSRRDDPLISPLVRIWEAFRTAHFYGMQGDDATALVHQRDTVRIEEQEGVRISPSFSTAGLAHMFLSGGNPREAWPLLEQARAMLSDKRKMEVVYFYWLELWALVLLGETARAHRLWDEFSQMPAIGVPFNTAYNHAAIVLLCERGEFSVALERIDRWRAGLAGMNSPLLDYNLDLMEAHVRVAIGIEEDERTALTRAFGVAARHGFYTNLSWIPRMMASLCARALQLGIERHFVVELVRRKQLRHAGVDDRWPWPIKIYVLGRFLVLKDDEPLRFGHRPQHRVLELLRALIAAGSAGASSHDLAATIWAAHDGDAAHAALTVALHRLRKLLGSAESVLMDAGWVRLNREVCWVDAVDFEDHCDLLLRAAAANLDASAGLALVERYSGPLFGGDVDSARAVAARDRLHLKFQRLVALIGSVLESNAELASATELYSRAVAIDSLNEDLYRRLMTCLHRMGRIGEAADIYRRCKQVLATTLNLKPSAESQSLASRLGLSP